MAGGISASPFFWGKRAKTPASEKPAQKPAKPGFSAPKLFARRPAHALTVITVDDKWIKVVIGRGTKVEAVAAVSVDGMNDEQVKTMLMETVRQEKLGIGPCCIAHPAQLTRTRFLRLPSTKPEELKTMIDLQVEKHTPDAKEDTLTYFRLLDSDSEGYSNVLLIMAHQDRIARSVSVVQRASRQIQNVSSDVEGLIFWYRNYVKLENEKHEGGTLLVDLDTDYASVLVMHGTEAYFHRSIPAKTDAILLEGGEEAEKFLAEIHRSILSYEDEGTKGPCTRVILIGEPVLFAHLSSKIEKDMKLPVKTVLANTGFELTPNATQQWLRISGMSMTGLFGFLTSEPAGDLMPHAFKMRQTFEKKVRIARVLTVQFIAFLLILSGVILWQTHEDLSYVKWLKSQAAQIEGPARDLETSLEHLRIIRGRIEQRGYLLDGLAALAKATPGPVRWDNLTYNQGQNLVLKGVSREIPLVFEMVNALEKSGLFVKPEARRVAKRKKDNQDITEFEILMPLAGAQEEAGE